MENFDRLSVLLQKSSTTKAHVISFQEFLAQFDTNNPAQISELQLRYNSVFANFSNLDDLYDEIQLIDTETDHSNEKKYIQDLYFQTLAQCQKYFTPSVSQFNINSQTNCQETVSNPGIGNESVASVNRRRLKLPQAVLPTFSGKVEEWLSFRDTFDTMINKRDDISKVEKLQYLKSALKDEALRKIQVFAITEENFERAWNLLRKSYEDKRTLISRHLSLLLQLPVQEKESYQGLIILADESQQHLQSLASLGVNVTQEMVVAIIEEKLHKSTLEKWDETIKNGEFPNLDDLTDFLYRTAARISKRKNDSNVKNSTDKDFPSFKKRKVDFKRHALVSAVYNKCPLCSESHYLFKCGKFLTLTVEERIKIVKEASLCFNCLRDHRAKNCKFGACKKCGKRHNTLLHFSKVQDSSKSNES